MTAMTPALTRRPAPVPRTADWLVITVMLIALVLGWMLRQQSLFATRTVNAVGVQVQVPAGSLPLRTSDQMAFTTPNGLTIRLNQFPAPPVGADDVGALAASRAVNQAGTLPMYRVVTTEPVTVGNQTGVVIEYVYVNSETDTFFTSTLQVIHGYELLVGHVDNYIVLTLEGPEGHRDDVRALWPHLIESLHF